MPNGTGLGSTDVLIELRLRPGDYRFRSVLRAVDANHLVRRGRVHRVPHLSLYGDFHVRKSQLHTLRTLVARTCSSYNSLPYLVDSYDWHTSEEGKVIAFGIKPSPQLLAFRNALAHALRKDFPSEKPWDRPDYSEPWFHVTIAHKLPPNEFERVWEYLNEGRGGRTLEEPRHVSRVRPYLPLEALRVTILDKGRIDREYDLAQHKLLSRQEALDWREWCRTYRAYRLASGQELERPGVLRRLVSRSRKKGTFFISDLHLDHANIIRYGSRPFCKDVKEMNRVLVSNWNLTVANNDVVYYLGDLTFGKDRRPSSFWWPRLRGEKTFVKGNHDDDTVRTVTSDKLVVKDPNEGEEKAFAIVHDPNEMPRELREWVETKGAWTIHGDKHNNDVRSFPFVNGEKRTINVSAEVVGYRPVSLDHILSMKLNSVERLDTCASAPIRR